MKSSSELDPFGCYRVIDPPDSLPQHCWRLNNTPVARQGETLVEVELLNLDSSSFEQLCRESKEQGTPLEELVLSIVAKRGKLHNPVTGSGGVLLGRTHDGRRIVSLVSLTMTPLKLSAVHSVNYSTGQLSVTGQAILFPRTLMCELPEDLPETVALAILDVAGAPAACAPLLHQARFVLIVGAGKAGFLTAAGVRKENPEARILAVDTAESLLNQMRELGLCDYSLAVDATNALRVWSWVEEVTGGVGCDLTVNLVNREGTEGASILATSDQGWVYFFGMSTSFSRAALTAEGLARNVRMLIGSGYTPGWTDYALSLVRENPPLRRWFEANYAG